MTSQSPRIYLYKITFEEVLYYYYGVHKEKKFDEYYMGSPKTHKWCWELYTPKKQILQFFEFSDEGWLEANKVEKRIIGKFYNKDKWCLNENCGGIISIQGSKTGGKIGGKKVQKILRQDKLGVYAITPEQRTENGKRGGKRAKEIGVGVHGRTKEKMTEDARKAGKRAVELKVGIHGRTEEQKSKDSRKGAKNTNSQKWKCLETGFIANPGNLTKYQNKRGIDTSKRKRIL